jgi:hypothetical protein
VCHGGEQAQELKVAAPGLAGESGKIRIGKTATQTATYIAGIYGVAMTGSPVVVNPSGKLGVGGTSSGRFKEQIKPMGKASEAILALKPVTFHYKDDKQSPSPQRAGYAPLFPVQSRAAILRPLVLRLQPMIRFQNG